MVRGEHDGLAGHEKGRGYLKNRFSGSLKPVWHASETENLSGYIPWVGGSVISTWRQFVEFLFDVGLEGFHFLFALGFALFFPRFVCLTCHFFLRFYCCQYVLLGNGCILPENNSFETVEEASNNSFVGFLRQK